jgi:hypothetical protein
MDERTRIESRISADLRTIGTHVLDEFDRNLEPSWKAQLDLTKTLLSLSSGSLALIATFGHLVLGPGTQPSPRWLLLLSLSFFVATVLSAVICLWRSIGVSEFRLLLYNAADPVASQATAALAEGRAPGDVGTAEIEKVKKQVTSSLHSTIWFFHATLVLFVIAFVLLGIFAWVVYGI